MTAKEKQQAWEARRRAVVYLRESNYSWQQIALALNTTRGRVERFHAKQRRIARQAGGKVECECPAWFDCTFIHLPSALCGSVPLWQKTK